MSSAFASIWGHNCRSASGTSFFCTTKSEIYWQELSTGWPGPWQKPPTNRFPIFLHCNNKQAVKRFLIAIRNSKTIPHWPISHSPVQFMGYLVVFINCAILLGGFWISASSVQIMHNILPKHWFPVFHIFFSKLILNKHVFSANNAQHFTQTLISCFIFFSSSKLMFCFSGILLHQCHFLW